MLIASIFATLKAIGPPGSIGFLALFTGIGVGLMVVWPKNRRLGRRWLAAVAGIYVILSLPLVANGITAMLPSVPTYEPRPGSIDTLLVLDGDNLQGRVDEAARIYKAAEPARVRVMGDWWTAKSIVEGGVPGSVVRRVPNSGTTREQVAILRELVADGHYGRIAVLVSRFQAPRIQGLISRRQLSATVITSPADREPSTKGLWRLVPAYGALCTSRDALYEHAALAYYRWRGWI